MDNIFGNLINAFAEIWRNIGVAQKVSILLIGFLAVGATGLIIFLGSRPDWQILYSNMDRETAAKVCDIVKDEGVEVKLTDGGRTVMVPAKKVYPLRLKVASEGVPVNKTGVGLEIFDEMKLGLTDKQQQVAYQRALQGELQRMITQMPGVVSCQVMLTMPKKQVFRRENSQPSASIMVVMSGGLRLSPRQINSIRYMVASAIEGMSPQKVTITDNQGNLLVKEVEEGEDGMPISSQQIELQNHMESALKRKAEAILEPIVGVGNVVAMVSCDVDFNRVDRVQEQYEPEKAVVVQEKIITEDQSKQGDTNGGKAGTASNMVSVANPGGASETEGSLSKQQKQIAERFYKVPKTVEKTTDGGGKIKRLTVAVSIAKKKDGSSWGSEKDKFKALVIEAVGAKVYGCEKFVTVEELEFVTADEPTTTPSAPITDQVVFNIEKFTNSNLIRPVVGLILLFVLYRVFRKYFQKSELEGAELGPGFMNGESLKSINEQLEEDQRKNELVEAAMKNQVQDSTNGLSPESVANVMEGWLRSDTGL